jgi:hypothetical protein
MVNEVENILREIRERIQAEEAQNGSGAVSRNPPPLGLSPDTVGADELRFQEGESLARVSSHLTTTGRAWDKLPPMSSNRKGGAARFELWIKARLKTMSHWFTWEQVNFNSAVHHALTDTFQTLTAQARELGRLQADLLRESETWKSALEKESKTLRAEAEGEIRRSNTRAAETNARLSEMRADMNARMTELAQQIGASHQRLHEQQRVCFQQLSLEVSEAARREDRGRRTIESRLDNLEKAKE